MLFTFKKKKEDKLALNIQFPENRKLILDASLEHRIPLIKKDDNIFIVDLKHTRPGNLLKFLKKITSENKETLKAVIDRDDPKCDYIVIFDVKEE